MIENYSEPQHYGFYKEVSESHGWPVLTSDLLPKTGFVSYVDEKPACIIFIYTTGTRWGVMEWLIADYSFDKKQRNEAITECIESAKSFANDNELTLFTSCKGAKLINRYENAGFIKTDEGMTNFVYRGQS